MCQLTEHEINTIAGVTNRWDCGQTIELEKRFHHINNIMFAQINLDSARTKLLELADKLRHVNVVVDGVTES